MLDHLLIWVNGRRHEIRGHEAFLSLSDFLRRSLGLTGTKVVCSEGDCGACSVLIGRPNASGSALTYRPIDSCIQFLFQLDGAHVVTVEGLGGETNPSAVQQAMIECHGSQCGFCTPGFVVAMTGLLEDRDELDESSMRCGLTGNLCRCTGYTPIIDAGRNIDVAEHERIESRFPGDTILNEFEQRRGQEVGVRAEWDEQEHFFISPANLDGVTAALAEHPDCIIVAGATDIGVRINKSLTIPRKILDLNRVDELAAVRVEDGQIILGARTSWSTIEKLSQEHVPEFQKIVAVFGAPQIRHVGTIGGNIVNASPIADSLPFLHVMEASLELRSAAGKRLVNINDFYQGYKKLDLRPGELVARVLIPLPPASDILRLYKISRRRDLDISTFTAAIRLRLDGDTIADAAIALGAVGPIVIRARKTESFLQGRPLTEETMLQAGDVAVSEITPISDVRGAADYRFRLTRNVLLKFFHETQTQAMQV
ncbi:MAG TPA: FAD binding domain-containing protein [Lacipirellulaceae bacterium]|jgi:xanthine dehydrogenase small subunit|nr:FAD binding domain-containing protein [Lacipirellulaceae bacterium]